MGTLLLQRRLPIQTCSSAAVKIALICIEAVLGLIVLAGIVLYLVGRAQPERHTASISITFALLDGGPSAAVSPGLPG